MTDGITLCAAAFLRNKGKNVVTEKEFLMGLSMDLHWMPYGDAQKLLAALISNGIFEKNGEFLRPKFQTSELEVPVAYRPPSDILEGIPETAPEGAPKAHAKTGNELLPELVAEAVKTGMSKKDFIAASNVIQKTLNVDILAAGLIVLRDKGVDISGYTGRVYDRVSKK